MRVGVFRYLRAGDLTCIRIKLVVDAAIDAAPRLLVCELPKTREGSRLGRKTRRSRPRHGEWHIVAAKHELKRTRGGRGQTCDVAGVRRIWRSGEQRCPERIGTGRRIEILIRSSNGGHRSP